MEPLNRGHSTVQVIDSHTAGEPTRTVIAGGPALGNGSLADRCALFKAKFDSLRSAIVCEPRGSEVVVGALLCEPVDPRSAAAVIFFNDVGFLGMCGHGTIGVITTLAHMGKLRPGIHALETPVGTVTTELHADGSVSVQNVMSFRSRAGVVVEVPGYGDVTGDIAWGGNWFFLVDDHGLQLDLANRRELIAMSTATRNALAAAGITAEGGASIDHIELTGSPFDPANSGRNFVLCPGTSFDRSPCGTGTSAKLACLHTDGKLAAGAVWRQEGILGTTFVGSYEAAKNAGVPNGVIPTITGRAWVTAESTLILDQSDPFCEGIRF
jgi:4-hydroxyproline epimerase